MTVHVHDLAGCTPTPLGSYLKALGILRLVAEQADPEVRGWWREERFWLATRLDRAELGRFFLDRYQPSPLLCPWNGGSGFYDSGKKDDPLVPVERSSAARFGALRDGLAEVRRLIGARSVKPEGDEKSGVVRLLTGRSSVHLRRWFAACIVVLEDESNGIALKYPAMLGSGGNDGNLEFTDQYLRLLPVLFDLASADGAATMEAGPWISGSLWGSPTRCLSGAGSGRQFDPGRAGAKNGGPGFGGRSTLNPWDFVLTLEGSTLLAASVHRSLDRAGTSPTAVAPFSVERQAAGDPSASDAEPGRSEQWLPLWSHPSTHQETQHLLREGRASLGRRGSSTSVDFARAIARLGVARGIDAFQRYSYQARNGNMHLAVPVARWRVSPQPHRQLLDQVDSWLSSLRRAARADQAPSSWRSASRTCDEAVLSICRNGHDASRWQRLLLALAEAERVFVANPRRCGKEGLRPIPPIAPEWVTAADDGTTEIRLALALACQQGVHPQGHPVREHWTPVDASGTRFALTASSLAVGPDLVCSGIDLERDCISLLRRRVLHAHSGSRTGAGREAHRLGVLPLVAAAACTARLWAIEAFLATSTNDAKILGLARAFMALRWRDWDDDVLKQPTTPPASARPHALHALFRLAHLPYELRRGADRVAIPVEPSVTHRLASGDLPGAADAALRRLRASGLRPVIRAGAGDASLARRLAASLAFALHPQDVDRCADSLTKPFQGDLP